MTDPMIVGTLKHHSGRSKFLKMESNCLEIATNPFRNLLHR